MKEKIVPKEITVSKGALMAQASRSVMSKTDKILVFSGQVVLIGSICDIN